MSNETDFLERHLDSLLSNVSSRNVAQFTSAGGLNHLALLLREETYRSYGRAVKEASQTKAVLLLTKVCSLQATAVSGALQAEMLTDVFRMSHSDNEAASFAALAALYTIIQHEEGQLAAWQDNGVERVQMILDRLPTGDPRFGACFNCLGILRSRT